MRIVATFPIIDAASQLPSGVINVVQCRDPQDFKIVPLYDNAPGRIDNGIVTKTSFREAAEVAMRKAGW